MKSIREFYLAHCFKILISGFALSALGIILYSQVQHKDPVLSKVAFGITAAGIGIYIIGRAGLIIQRRKARKQREERIDRVSTEIKDNE